MLAFDPNQFARFSQDRFVSALTRHWQRSWPALFRGFSDAELRRLALTAVRSAEAEGITLERDVYTWCDLCIAARSEFAASIPRPAGNHGGR